ncbi:MAG: hypothetical protein WA982_13255 [Rubrobacteraceae bacterium]
MDDKPVAPGPHYFTCPLCEMGVLRPLGGDSAKCGDCGCLIGGEILTTLEQVYELPEVFGKHACECGHPEMRHLPDDVFRCPSCGAEVLPLSSPATPWKQAHSEAYWSGWMDGRFHDTGDFIHNPRLSKWPSAADRLDYYQGHRAGHEVRSTRKRGAIKASYGDVQKH